MGYCIVHNPLLLQPLRHWFTFIFRKYEHLAVGSWGKGLTRSRGHPPFVVALPSPFVPLLYHTLRGLSRGFLNFFCSVGRFCFTSPNYALGRGCSLLSASFVPLLYHNLGDLSRGFQKFSQISFQPTPLARPLRTPSGLPCDWGISSVIPS